jgi:hypothetical protein
MTTHKNNTKWLHKWGHHNVLSPLKWILLYNSFGNQLWKNQNWEWNEFLEKKSCFFIGLNILKQFAHNVCEGFLNNTKSTIGGPMVWEGYDMVTSQTNKKIDIYILMYRFRWARPWKLVFKLLAWSIFLKNWCQMDNENQIILIMDGIWITMHIIPMMKIWRVVIWAIFFNLFVSFFYKIYKIVIFRMVVPRQF